ncbi:MAG: outer membrane protein assembly factor BamB family protein [Promethearchaeota archaeon]
MCSKTNGKGRYQVAPWPSMRGSVDNAGRLADLEWVDRHDKAREVHHFRTGNAIFSTPVIDGQERVYVGSADHCFYAFGPLAGKELWHHELGEVIDSAACIDREGTIFVGAGDAKLHAFTPGGSRRVVFDALANRGKWQFTFSTNFWFEANVVVGPDGALYVANDDFFLYKITPGGQVVWAFRTGFLLWSAVAFGRDGTVYLAGFDQLLYALDAGTGRCKWKVDLHGALVSSPAVGGDGTVYVGGFDGNVHAVDGATGRVRWTFDTGSHVYASAAIAPGGRTVYIGSTNGVFYALGARTGRAEWTYYIGDAIRSSASLGPDPEGKCEYLVYFGGGDGVVYALDPRGRLRWSYDTLARALETDYPNINASIALGSTGLAVACSTGDVVWIPYDQYLSGGGPGFQVGEPVDEWEGPQWHFVTPGGKLEREPLVVAHEIPPTGVVSLRLLLHEESRAMPTRIAPGSIRLDPDPPFEFRVGLQSDGHTINVIVEEILPHGVEYSLGIRCRFATASGLEDPTRNHEASIALRVAGADPADPAAPEMATAGQSYRILHMAIPTPRIVPSLNQIGFASLEIPFSIADVDPTKGTFVAWAVQKFGEVGVPLKRVSFYGFSGRALGGEFVMDARNCLFEITSFNIPLTLFRVAGRLQLGGTVAPGSSLLIEKDWGDRLVPILREMGGSSPLTPKMLLEHLRTGGPIQFLKAAARFFPGLVRQFGGDTWKAWGLTNHEKKLLGVGTFKLTPLEARGGDLAGKVGVQWFGLDKKGRKIVAEVELPRGSSPEELPVGVMVAWRERMKVVPVNYTTELRRACASGVERVELALPSFVRKRPGKFRAYLFADVQLLKNFDF